MNRGSEWRKWNFHVHTKGTNKNDQFSSRTMDEFFCIFFRKAFENQVSAIGITDYFSIDRYLDAIEYQKTIEDKENQDGSKAFSQSEVEFIKGIFLFPNVELRMTPSTDKGNLINIHCIFNPDYVPDLENDFFSSLENQDNVKMNRHGITSYGKKLDPSLTEEHLQYKMGLDHFVIDLKSLKSLLENQNFRDNTLLVVSNSNKDGASALQKNYQLFEKEEGKLTGFRNSIYKISDAIFSTNEKDIRYFLGKISEGTPDYNEETYKRDVKEVITSKGSLKPCIVGCDAHEEKHLFSRFTWIKSDLNFEGLRQICFEPESRVKIQNEKPDFKEDKLIIDRVRYISPKNVFSNNPIPLNSNLNVIIGGKSSGKSILLYCIAKTLSPDTKVLKNDDESEKYNLKRDDKEFDFEITTKGGFSQRLNREQDKNSIIPEIKYIPQNYLVKLAEPELNKKGEPLNKLVRGLITEDSVSKELYQRFITKVSQNDRLRNSQIDLFFETLNDINNLENELKTKSNKSVLEQNIKSNQKKVEELNKGIGLTPNQVDQYKQLQNQLEVCNSNLQKLRDDFAATKAFNTELEQILKNLKQRKDNYINSLQSPTIKDHFQAEYKTIDALFAQSLSLESVLQLQTNSDGEAGFKPKSGFKTPFDEYDAERLALQDSLKPLQQDEKTKSSIQEINQSVANDKRTLAEIESLTKKIKEKRNLLNDSKEEIFKIYTENYGEYEKVIAELKERIVELEKDGLEIHGIAQFNFPKLRKQLFSMSDGRSASYSRYSILSSDRKATDISNFQEIIEELKTLFEEILTGDYALTTRINAQTAIKTVLDDYFFDYWEIKYKNDKLGEMSTGKASFVILMLIIGLSRSKAPILIDQPEDNLDNRSITSDLVKYLRNKKLERQIIVVTHNANIVVNADAENVVVANQKGQNDDASTSQFKFNYVNGAIENSLEKNPIETDILKSMGIRQHIADIVEGGKEAFIKRERKYRFR